MFKLAHISDPHAGYKATSLVNAQGINLREADGYLALSRIITEIIEEGVDATVWAGDTFHQPSPDIRTIIFVQNQLRRLWSAGIPAYLLAGNHDTNDIRADIAASRVLHDPWRKVFSHAEPYVTHEIADGIHLHMVSHHMYGEQADTMKLVKPVDGEINILSTHGSIFDKYLHETLHAEQSPREIVIPPTLLDDHNWSYSLFGHIHERGWVGSTDGMTDTAKSKIYYNGSTIRRGFSDKEAKLGRGWTLWTIDESGAFTADVRTIAQRPQYDFATIDAKNLNASDITERILDNLQETQVNGTSFDARIAPILRQTIINISPAKYQALDWGTIDKNTKHAMSWSVKHATLQPLSSKQQNRELPEHLQGFDNSDVVKGYDEWVNTAPSLQGVETTTKERVVEQARNFVKLGQEETLESE